MRCAKCNHEMKEYTGLFEKGWDCVNQYCGNETHDLALDIDGNVVGPEGNTFIGTQTGTHDMCSPANDGGVVDQIFLSPDQLDAYKKLFIKNFEHYYLDALRYSFYYKIPQSVPSHVLIFDIETRSVK